KLGYKSIFWSFAYKDYDVKAQPGKDAAYQMVMKNVHPGAILLLHAVSQSNTEALPDILRDLKAQGYTFLPLTALK
ncbi:MAG: polysaccharide deacetylase, partial [Methylocystaceae bacterium]